VNWPLVAALASAGLAIGWLLCTVVFRLAVPAGEPRRTNCPRCGYQVLRVGRRLPTPSPFAPSAPSGPSDPFAPSDPSDPFAPSAPSDSRTAADRRLRGASFLRGRCPSCRARIGPPPLALELCTAILLGALAARVHPGLVLAAACWLAVCAVALAWIDVAVQRLPDVLTALAYAGTVGLLLLAAATGGHWPVLLRALLGGLGLAAGFLALAVIGRGAVGLGDAKLSASLGTMLAWSGWPALAAGVFAGFLLAAVYGLGLLVSGRATRGQRIPFGPFMIAGAFLAVLAAAGVAGP
jgi:leader peptidase (prepilin peptidase) / N-methyltransferase